MTLHWWMHWFWITYQVLACYCSTVTSPVYSVPPNLHETARTPTPNRSVKAAGGSKYIPPITSAFINVTTVIPIKMHKSPKKHELFWNMTNKSSVTTASLLVKGAIAMDRNFTDGNSDIADNQTLLNSSLDAINRADNVSELNDRAINRSTVANSEFVGIEDQEASKESLTAAGITGITLGCISIVGIVCAASCIMYRNYGFNRPQVLNDRCSNPDSSGYIDDSTVRENSEEMYSLDNDSFLNSLEAMTIQNLWTDTVKHTKL